MENKQIQYLSVEELREVVVSLREQNQNLLAELETWRRVHSSDDLLDMAEVAKILNYKNMGRNNLFKFLKCIKILRDNTQPYQVFIDRGYFKVIETPIIYGMSEVDIYTKTLVTQKGLVFIKEKLEEWEKKV
jgi:anti-repressor protein